MTDDDNHETTTTNPTMKNNNRIRLSQLPNTLRGSAMELVKEFDVDGDGAIEVTEFAEAVKALKSSRDKNRNLTKILSALAVGTLLLAGGVFGVSVAAARLAKDTVIDADGTVRSKKNGSTMKTAEALFVQENVTSIPSFSKDELKGLKYISFMNDEAYFNVKGYSRSMLDETVETVTLLVEGGTITFDNDGITNSTGYATILLEELVKNNKNGRNLEWKDIEEDEEEEEEEEIAAKAEEGEEGEGGEGGGEAEEAEEAEYKHTAEKEYDPLTMNMGVVRVM